MTEDSDYLLALALHEELNGNSGAHNVQLGQNSNNKASKVHPMVEDADPTIDVPALFRRFDKKFFNEHLVDVEIEWSKRLKNSAGICYKSHWGPITIRLSEPLLKFRTRKELIEIILHEMIHAYCYKLGVRERNGGHGPIFKKIMNAINKVAGTNITVLHNFRDEMSSYKDHLWRCVGICQARAPFYGFIVRSNNEKPGPDDTWWVQHQRDCRGTFYKIRGPDVPKNCVNIKNEPKENPISSKLMNNAPPVDREHLRNIWANRFSQNRSIKSENDKEVPCSTSKKQEWQEIEDDIFILDKPNVDIEISDESDDGILIGEFKPLTNGEHQNALKRDIILDNTHLLHEDIILIDYEFDDSGLVSAEKPSSSTSAATIEKNLDLVKLLDDFEMQNDLTDCTNSYSTDPANDIITCPLCCNKITRNTFHSHLDGCTGIRDEVKLVIFKCNDSLLNRERQPKKRKSVQVINDEKLPCMDEANIKKPKKEADKKDFTARLQRQEGIYSNLRQCPLCGYYLDEDSFSNHRFTCNSIVK